MTSSPKATVRSLLARERAARRLHGRDALREGRIEGLALALKAFEEHHGFVLSMWTGLFTGEDGLPLFFTTTKDALARLERYPSWGRSAVEVRECTVRPIGRDGKPDYVIGGVVAHGGTS